MHGKLSNIQVNTITIVERVVISQIELLYILISLDKLTEETDLIFDRERRSNRGLKNCLAVVVVGVKYFLN